jgi:sec-independent protein translocase protein TatB
MFNLDPGKLLVIAVVAIILLGPDRLPQVARQAGNAWRSFNEFRRRMESEVRSTMPDLPPTSEIARLARSPSALLNHLSTMAGDDDGPEETAKADGAAGTDGAGAVAGNGAAAGVAGVAGVASGENGSAAESTGTAPAPAPPPSLRSGPAPVPHVPDTSVPPDPNLN